MKKILIATILTFIIGCGSASDEDVFFATQNPNSSTVESSNAASQVTTTSTTPQPVSVTVTQNPTTAATTTTSSTNSNSSTSNLRIGSFIWKPVSERDGNLVVLVDLTNVRIEVFGNRSDTLTDFGPSNGKGTTARAPVPGCSYGNDVLIEFYDSQGRRINLARGGVSFTVNNGCERAEF